jgi:hypothetical protein
MYRSCFKRADLVSFSLSIAYTDDDDNDDLDLRIKKNAINDKKNAMTNQKTTERPLFAHD